VHTSIYVTFTADLEVAPLEVNTCFLICRNN